MVASSILLERNMRADNINIWTPETEEQLRKLWSDKSLTGADIAQKFGCSRSAILGKVRRMKLSYRELGRVAEEPKHLPNPKLEKVRQKKVEKTETRTMGYREAVQERTREREQAVELDPSKFKKLVDLHITKECHYAVTDNMLFCGKPTTGKTVYCKGHENICISGTQKVAMTRAEYQLYMESCRKTHQEKLT